MQDSTVKDFVPGQRWISDSEPELGLGLIAEIEHRMLTVDFLQSGETRLYAKASAPLTRIIFAIDDEIQDREQNVYRVVGIENVDDLLVYQVKSSNSQEIISLPETQLSDAISLNQPLNRLISGQVDHSQWYQLRAQTLEVLNFIEKSPLLGLCSARTELIPHQLFIANEVAKRHAPRVLLADEVGLGKTIEACLILQQQLFSGLASRILIIVPESLVHQWLVELLRRFNLAFSIFDQERCSINTEDDTQNPFETEQLVLCSSELFIHSPDIHKLALDAEWDLLIVDEAHHLKPADSTQDFPLTIENIAYANIESLSAKIKGLLLLTATPDQLGQQSHFALLRLLDPDRFHSYPEFIQEQKHFIGIAGLIEALEAISIKSSENEFSQFKTKLLDLISDPQLDTLIAQLQHHGDSTDTLEESRKALVSAILDRHGTGRVLFRNTRKVVAGFPKRLLHTYPLIRPDIYQDYGHCLQPELNCIKAEWLKDDPRVDLIEDLLNNHKEQKVLFICANKTTAITLDEHLRLHKGFRTSVFHEDMSIIERDRSAAYFAEKESGSQILLCSEIGSEGRNFQFSHHLILFDLPLNPDLLEQRIGRLDRIGQQETINIHVPYIQNTAQETLLHWYHKSLNAFQKTNPAAYKVFTAVQTQLENALKNESEDESQDIQDLLQISSEKNQLFSTELQQGRDRLLEINSFNPELSQRLVDDITQLECERSPESFLNSVFDSFGIGTEQDIDHSWILRPGDDMVVSSFPAIPDHGLTLSYQRELALHREDIQFVNWFHPIVTQSIDLVLQGDLGKSSLALMQDKRFVSGTFLLESLYRIDLQADKKWQVNRFLPATTLRVLVDTQERDLSEALTAEQLNQSIQHVDKTHLMSFLAENKNLISELSEYSENLASIKLPAIVKHSSTIMLSSLSTELKRLVALKQVNPNIRQSEIEFLSNQVRTLHQAYSNATLQLEGLRLIVIV